MLDIYLEDDAIADSYLVQDTTLFGLANGLNADINRTLGRTPRDQFDEDYITRKLVDMVRSRLNHARLLEEPELVSISACAYKLKGKRETNFGDLAVLVRISFRDGTMLNGAAMYEAKRRDWGTSRLKSVKRGQLSRIYRNTWHGRLLMYDHEPVPVHRHPDPRWPVGVLLSAANVVHLSHPVELGVTDTSLIRYADPFAYQLCCRNLRGMDLELDENVVNCIAEGADILGAPKYVVSVALSYGEGAEPDATSIEVNKDTYESLPPPAQKR